jgi:hypothetical protein
MPYFGMQRAWLFSVVLAVFLVAAVVTFGRSSGQSSEVELITVAQIHKLAQEKAKSAKATGLLGSYERWKQKSNGKSAEGLVLEEPKLNDALTGLTSINVKKGSKKAAALLKAQAELRRVLAETASDQKLGQSAIEGTE